MPAYSDNPPTSEHLAPTCSDAANPANVASGAAHADVDLAALSGLELAAHGLAMARDQIVVHDSTELAAVMTQVEQLHRQSYSLSVDLLTLSDHGSLHYRDGHRSASVMMRHVNKLASGDASARKQCQAMFKALPLIAAASRAGTIGGDQIRLLARVFANRRVRGAMDGRQDLSLIHI